MMLKLVVPCYNEQFRLPVEQFASFAATHPHVSFLFVNDGSTDQTGDVLGAVAARNPAQFSMLSLERNVGKGEAVRAGLLAVVREGSAELTGFWDADLATPLDQVERFVSAFRDDADVLMVIGSRVKLLGRDIQRRAVRHYLGRVAATAISVSLGIEVYDTQCGAKLFRGGEPLRPLIEEPFVSRWLFDVELLVRANAQLKERGMTLDDGVVEMPLRRWTDVAGSKVRSTDFMRAGADLVRIVRKYR